MVRRLSISALQRLLRVALVLPLVLFALIPPGVMPGHDGAGSLTLVLCSGDGLVEVVIDAATGQPVEKQQRSCDWACAQASVALIAQPHMPLRPAVLHRAAPVTETAVWRPAHDPRSLWARGPPSLA